MSEGFGQIYQQMFTGSLVGSGAVVFTTMAYVIANTDPITSTVRLNPKLLATVFGEPEEVVAKAIAKLCEPDPNSTTPDEGGRRLIKEGQFEYFVVNYKKYRGLLSKERRRQYMASLMQERRSKGDDVLTGANNMLTGANGSASASASVSASEREKEKVPKKTPPQPLQPNGDDPFEMFWKAYPRRVAKDVARKAFKKHGCGDIISKILASLVVQKRSEQWTKEDGRFIPHPSTWINQHRWEDELVIVPPAEEPDRHYGNL